MAFSCPHCPFQEEEAVEWLLAQIRKQKPTHVVCLGDLLSADAASRFFNEDPAMLEDEYEAAAHLLRRIREACGNRKVKFVWIKGNHDANITEQGRLPKAVRSLLTPEKAAVLAPELEHWEIVPYENSENGCYRIGKVGFYHGFDCGMQSDRDEAFLFSGGRPYFLGVRGHTHRAREVTQVQFSARLRPFVWFANAGTLGPLQPSWASRQNTREWRHAVVVVDIYSLEEWGPQKTWDAVTIFKER